MEHGTYIILLIRDARTMTRVTLCSNMFAWIAKINLQNLGLICFNQKTLECRLT